MKTPGEIAHEAFCEGTVHVPWDRLGPDAKEDWERAVRVVCRKLPEKVETTPAAYLDGKLTKHEFTINADDCVQLDLRVVFMPSMRYHKTPGATVPMLRDLLEQAKNDGTLLRIATTTKDEVLSEYARLQPDGTLRQFDTEFEATW